MCNPPQNRDEYSMHLQAELCQMIEEAKQHPEGRKKRHLINSIIRRMQSSGQIPKFCPSSMKRHSLSDGEHQQNFQDALQITWVWFGKNCCNYDPDRASVIGWFLTHLKLNKRNVDTKYLGLIVDVVSVDDLPNSNSDEARESLENVLFRDNCDPMNEVERRDRLIAIRECVQGCKILQTKIVSIRSEINCRELLLLRLPEWDESEQRAIPGQDWDELESKFDVPRRLLIDCYNSYHTDKRCLMALKTALQSRGFEVI